MQQVLQDFIKALRSSGVRISVAENMDAMHAAALVGYGSRRALKDALASSLAKSQPEKEIFSTTFERYFQPDRAFESESDTPTPMAEAPEAPDAPLTQMLLAGDQAGLSLAMRQAAQQIDVSAIWFFTQKSLYVQRMMNAMGAQGLDGDIRGLGDTPGEAAQQRLGALRDARAFLYENVRDFVEQQYSLFSGLATEDMMERYLRNLRLSNLEQQDFHRMQNIIEKMVKRLNDLHSRRKRKADRGCLDLKKTLRKNMAYQGILFEPQWKRKKVDRPDIVAICDVSRSVEAYARFMLLFLYSLSEAVVRIRSYIFCSNLAEASHVFEECGVEETLVRLQKGIGLGIMLGRTDYGQAWRDFRDKGLDGVTKKTTVIVLGDARNNYGDPETGILKTIHRRAKRVIWLTPEPPSFWGTGDSEMKRYLPYCYMVKECSTVRHLQRVVDFLLTNR
ncbi:MAG: VWA domain-containing protein [Deltaproteobacteria bacterium]|nr:VWA domain-containing protein [Deltaproteobacteria bacterium]MBW1815694.1 VWA domain-containing protein [Deltaproteobacteria bacterium]MBW2284021.1 VWA domain-containing protein [Deltaproteobacteria bacterium]